ncbi:hypothetical protein ABT143_00710, partial [Streptomyces sp. NPDC002033]
MTAPCTGGSSALGAVPAPDAWPGTAPAGRPGTAPAGLPDTAPAGLPGTVPVGHSIGTAVGAIAGLDKAYRVASHDGG